jgi:hypothetical protein
MADQQGGTGVQVTMAAILDQVHANYTQIVSRLTQENAELQAGVDAMKSELLELRSKLAALQPKQGPSGLVVPQPAIPRDVLRGVPAGPDRHA